jgi:hypothetical protein
MATSARTVMPWEPVTSTAPPPTDGYGGDIDAGPAQQVDGSERLDLLETFGKKYICAGTHNYPPKKGLPENWEAAVVDTIVRE